MLEYFDVSDTHRNRPSYRNYVTCKNYRSRHHTTKDLDPELLSNHVSARGAEKEVEEQGEIHFFTLVNCFLSRHQHYIRFYSNTELVEHASAFIFQFYNVA